MRAEPDVNDARESFPHGSTIGICRRVARFLVTCLFLLICHVLPVSAEDIVPSWHSDLPSGNQCLSKLITVVSGKPNSESTDGLLRGVDKVSFCNDLFTFHREDDQELLIGAGTALGDRMLKSLEKTKIDTDKYSGNLSQIMSEFKAVQITGNHVEIVRDGEENVSIPVSDGVKKLPFRLKEVRLGRLSLDLDESQGFPAIKNLTGLEAIVKVGIDFHIVLKEFWRTKNDRGDTTVTVGIVNPLPRAVRAALGLKEITHVSHTIRKKQEPVSVVLPQSNESTRIDSTHSKESKQSSDSTPSKESTQTNDSTRSKEEGG